MAFGLSFGSKKGKTSSVEDTNQTQTSNTSTTSSGSSTTNTSGSTTGTTTQSGTSGQQTTNQQNTSQTGQQQTSGTTSSFSDEVLNQLEQSVLGGLGSSVSTATVLNAVKNLGNFDANGYVANSVASARAAEQTNLDATLGGFADSIGSGIGNNSMAALLAQRAQGDAAARVAGVEANAQQTAQQILRDNSTAAVSAAQGQDQLTSQLLAALKGGQTTTTEGITTSTTGSTRDQGYQTGQTASTGTSSEQQQQSSQTNQQMTELVNALTTLIGTTTTKGKSSSGGFGISI